ncbi:hypothetical protein D9611_002766 [Ephemerocybe angulata]|uniref:Uncharacterized protein n=1 Tax=Ephemerocybe angulata TaxID=980116 RepID=A0A8H5C263_9AGAR|nr:hypothetical protein D9611_002766 [Tulosesus angulatus]
MDVEAITRALRDAIINGYRATTITNAADFLHTFPDEPSHSVSDGQVVDLSPKACKAAFWRLGGILFIRVYAFSGRNKKGVSVSSFILLTKFMATVEYFEFPFGNVTCMPVAGKSYLLGAVFAILLTSVVGAPILWKEQQEPQNTKFLASANIFVAFAAPEGYKFLFVQTEADIHVILSTRMLLHLREWAERETVVESGRNGGGLGGGMGMGFSTTLQRHPSPMEFQKRSDLGEPWKGKGCNTPTTASTGRWTTTTLDDYSQDSHGRIY